MRLALGLFALTLSGCTLYFGGDDEPPICSGGGYDGDSLPPDYFFRNPETGECQSFGGGGGGCDSSCGPCAEIALAPAPNWAACYTSCDALDEATCLGTSGCEASYHNLGPYGDDGLLVGDDAPSSYVPFMGCFATAPTGPIQGSCFNLDAQECSRHDDCVMIYGGDDNTQFEQCAPEPTVNGCTDVACGPGSHCETNCYAEVGDDSSACVPMCVPDNSYGCAAIDCGAGYECVEQCDVMDPTAAGCFPGQCYATCVPTTACETITTETECATRNDCTNVYDGDNCTCYPGGACECDSLTWDRCETVGGVPMPW